MQWRQSTTKKFKQSNRKMIPIVVPDKTDILWVNFMECGTRITAQVYCETLNKLQSAILNKRYLAPDDYFLHLKQCFGGQRFETEEKV